MVYLLSTWHGGWLCLWPGQDGCLRGLITWCKTLVTVNTVPLESWSQMVYITLSCWDFLPLSRFLVCDLLLFLLRFRSVSEERYTEVQCSGTTTAAAASSGSAFATEKTICFVIKNLICLSKCSVYTPYIHCWFTCVPYDESQLIFGRLQYSLSSAS